MKKKAVVFGMIGFMVSTALATTTNSGSDGVENGTTTTSSSPSIKDSSNQSSSGNGLAQAVNYVTGGAEVVMGGVMIKTGSASHNYGEVAMGVLMVSMGLTNIAQGNDHGSAANTADTTGFQTDGYGSLSSTGTEGTTTTDATVAAALADSNYKAVGSTLKELQASGVYDPKTGAFTVGDKTYSSSDLASTASMASAGIPQSTIDSAMALSNDLEKKALAKLEKVKASATAENGYEEGGGGSNRNVATTEDENSGLGTAAQNKNASLNKGLSNDPTLVAGLTKNYNGEPIGVAADNIFLMISRRYKLKESQETFLDPKSLTTTAQTSK